MSLSIASAPPSSADCAGIADTALAWATRSAERLKLPLPVTVANALADAFPYPLNDARYADNALAPGCAALEASFSEARPEALRIDFEPYNPGMPLIERREMGAAQLRRWAAESFTRGAGQEARRWLHAFDGSSIGAPVRFGAFLGATIDAGGLAEAKLYAEWNAQVPAGLPARLAATADSALATVPGLAPHFASLACNRSGCVPRLYFLCREELPLLVLCETLHTAGLIHRLPQLAALLSPFLAEAAVLPAGAAVLSFREDERGLDCKIELLAGAFPTPAAVTAAQISQWARTRPDIAAPFQRWRYAIGGGSFSPGKVNAVGFRVLADGPPQFGIYVCPFDRLTRRQA